MDNLNTLLDYRYRQHYKAKNGGHGKGQDRTGAKGADMVLKVPLGTQIFDEDGATLIADLAPPGDRILLVRGGNGGFGNAHFKSSTNRAPRQANPGQPGEEMDLAEAEADRRCRTGRAAQCRQIDPACRGQRGEAEDRRLSLHHADPNLGVVGSTAAIS